MSRLMCLVGLGVFIGIAWTVSSDRKRFPWRVVLGGLGLQVLLALFVLRTSMGQTAFQTIGSIFTSVMGCVDVGSDFVFARNDDPDQRASLISTFAFGVLPTVIFFSSLMSVLYYLGIMQWVVRALAWVMQRSLGTTGPETLAAAANVFVGHTEAPLVVRPYLERMSRSELCAMMTGGFATVTGGLLGAYAAMGIDIAHLLTASVISAPAALLIAKVMVPPSPTDGDSSQLEELSSDDECNQEPAEGPVNLIAAAVEGASDGLRLALNVGAMLIAFLSLIALIDLALATACTRLGWVNDSGDVAVTLGVILGYVGWPFAWLLGIPAAECQAAGELLAIKTIANEFVAFAQLGEMAQGHPTVLSERSVAVLTYALAGFSNFAAIGIQVGGIGGLVPTRKTELAQLGLRAMLGGLLACCMTGAVAGLIL
ncbi:MAG: nucleoside transporter C-terminal domain-containing protein [Planctomycetota bacterium]